MHVCIYNMYVCMYVYIYMSMWFSPLKSSVSDSKKILTPEKWVCQSPIFKISLNQPAAIILSLDLSLCK